MRIKFSQLRLSIIFLLVIFLPLAQNQWLNLYLFDTKNFTIYKLLYFCSGLIFPIIVCITSFRNFTFYKFNNIKSNANVGGKSLLLITLIAVSTLSTIISSYLFVNYKILFNFYISDSNNLLNFNIDKHYLFVVIISILLLFKKTKVFIKKIILTNFFMISFMIWYSKINNLLLNDTFLINNSLKFENTNFLNLLFLLSIEIIYYLWSYISYSSNLSDWTIPIPIRADLSPFLSIIFFYLMIFLYYLIL